MKSDSIFGLWKELVNCLCYKTNTDTFNGPFYNPQLSPIKYRQQFHDAVSNHFRDHTYRGDKKCLRTKDLLIFSILVDLKNT